MEDVKKKKLNKLKFTYVAGSLVGFIIVAALIFVAFAVMLAVFGLYIADSKIRDENTRAMRSAAIYETAEQTGDEGVLRLIGDEENAYIITDGAGNIESVYGKNTCDLQGGGAIDVLAMAEAVSEEVHEGINID